VSGFGYPPDVHAGEDGAVSAVLRRAEQPRELEYGPGTGAAYLATGADTRGAFGLYRWDMGGPPAGPSPHFHRGITESFFVLSGTVRLYDGARWAEGTAGDFLFVPEGGVHAFRNESGEPASMLLLFTPGAPREEYFEALGDAGRRREMSEQDWLEFCVRHDTFWVDGG